MISMLSFVIIHLPPGDFVDYYASSLETQGNIVSQEEREALRSQFGLDRPVYVQYFTWIGGVIFRGKLGYSFYYSRDVDVILKECIPRTAGISLVAIVLTWILALPIGLLSAIKQYSVADHFFTFLSFVGLAIPTFMSALVLMYIIYQKTGWAVTGIHSPEYQLAPWSIGKFIDMCKNLWLPVLILSFHGMASIVRILRGMLLDELGKQYVTTARSKGMTEQRLLIRYPLRVAILPLISTIGWMLPLMISGEIVVSKVLDLPTTGPVLLNAIFAQDIYLVGGIVLIISVITIIGTLVSDILLAVADPRIRIS
jgi:peptide/nickel transport system permease protein